MSLAYEAEEAGAGGVCGLMEHHAGRRSDAGGQEAESSPAVEGKLPKDGLAVIRDDGGDPMLALARPMVNGEETEDG